MAPPPAGTGSTGGVWTGDEVLIVSNRSTAFYDPIADSWRQVETGIVSRDHRPGLPAEADPSRWPRSHQLGSFEEVAEFGGEAGGYGPVDDAVVDADREVHDLSDGDLVVDRPWPG